MRGVRVRATVVIEDSQRAAMTTPSTSTRSTAAERREHLLECAMHEFAQLGYEGGSTERIARAAGISQPYVFRLFGSKLQLFLAVIERCFEETLTMFEEAAAGHTGEPALVKAGLAHLWFVTLHPFDDGNGRIARALTDLALAQGEGQSIRFYAMSVAILADRKGYYRHEAGARDALTMRLDLATRPLRAPVVDA